MRKVLFAAAGAAALLIGQPVAAQTQTRGITTATLAEACASETREAAGAIAVGFCRGFMAGAGQYHREMSTDRPVIFCLPTPSPSFEAAQASFVAWARGNPQLGGEQAVDGMLRWAAAAYPCPAAPARAAPAAEPEDPQ
ncbi:Rap1a/Tai family immunity protein [Paeniroseomonas aquatica]|uniref:Rap1a/Tai family immunity protein n=1 Tax=Paeniroseomonas aquatica TaxID=373043 RepID=UPI00362170F5